MSCCAPVMKNCLVCGESTQVPNTVKYNCGCCYHKSCLKSLNKCPHCKISYSGQWDACHLAILTAYCQASLKNKKYVGPYHHIVSTLLRREEGGNKRYPMSKDISTSSYALVNCVGWEIFECYQKSEWTWEMIVAFVVVMIQICNKDIFKISVMIEHLSTFMTRKLDIQNWNSFVVKPVFIDYMNHEYLIYKELMDYTNNGDLWSMMYMDSTLRHPIECDSDTLNDSE